MEANVPTHELSTLAMGIFYVCLGRDKEAINVFQQFGPNNNVLMSDDVFEMADELQFRLSLFHAPTLNTYASTFKFSDDEVIPTPTCEFVHDINFALEGTCKHYRLYWISLNILHML